MKKVILFVVLALLSLVHSAPTVYRSVKDYGATGNGNTDDTQAIINALTQGRGDTSANYPDTTYSSSTQHPAYVFFPPGTYLVTQTLPVVYYTQMVCGCFVNSFYLNLFNYALHFSIFLDQIIFSN